MLDNDILVGQNPTGIAVLEINLYLITVVLLFTSSNVTDLTYLHIILSIIYTYLITYYSNYKLQEDTVY